MNRPSWRFWLSSGVSHTPVHVRQTSNKITARPRSSSTMLPASSIRRCPPVPTASPLPIALGHTLQLVLLLDRIGVTASLCSVDQLLSKTFGNALDISEGCFAGTDREKSDGLVDTAERGDIDGLSSDSTGATNACAVFARSAVDDGVNGDLNGVLVGHDVNDLEGVSHYSDGHQLLAVVSAVHHKRVRQSLDDWALCFPESLRSVSTSGVRDVNGRSNLNVISQRDISDFDILVAPFIEQFDTANL